MQGRALGLTIKVNAKRIMLSPSESGLKNKKNQLQLYKASLFL